MSRTRKIRFKWLAEFCIIENFQFVQNEVYEVPADWHNWVQSMNDAKRLELVDHTEETKEDVTDAKK